MWRWDRARLRAAAAATRPPTDVLSLLEGLSLAERALGRRP